jgi:hypothetical protein
MIDGGESISLSTDIWEPMKVTRGERKGKDPIVTESGMVFVGKDRIGEEVKVFGSKHNQEK